MESSIAFNAYLIKAAAVLLCGQLLMAPKLHAQSDVVKRHQKISDTQGGFTGTLYNSDEFGLEVAGLGDLDGDSVADIAVGAWFDDDGGNNRGAVWILFLNADGTVKSHQKISDTQGGFTGILGNDDRFGTSVARLGDLDGDGVEDIAVGAIRDDDGGTDRGAVWILYLNADGTVKSHRKISHTEGGFTGTLANGDHFGRDVVCIGDLDGDSNEDLVVGAYFDGGTDRGAVWILFLNADGTVKGHQKISDTEGGFTGTLSSGDLFGITVDRLGDLDGDTVEDIAVGAVLDDDGGADRGAVWILFLNTDGTVKSHQKISDTAGGFTGALNDGDRMGISVAGTGDLDGDAIGDVAVGAYFDDDGGGDRGAVWILFLNADGTVKRHQKISDTQGGFTGTLGNDDRFGVSIDRIGDMDGDGLEEVAVGAHLDDDGGTNRGSVWVLFLDEAELPVELTAFTATAAGADVLLSWQTAAETNNAGFEIEQRRAGAWARIGFVEGHGTTLEPQRYHHRVEELSAGTYRFRLKQVDFDGAFAYSPEVEVAVGVPGAFHLSAAYPNPFNPETQFTLQLAQAQHVAVAVYDAVGRQVALLHEGPLEGGQTHRFRFTAAALPSGIYLVRVVGEQFSAARQVVLMK